MKKKGNKITIVKGDGFMQITVEGHNKDPKICAGISAIMQTTEAGLELLADSVDSVTIKKRIHKIKGEKHDITYK